MSILRDSVEESILQRCGETGRTGNSGQVRKGTLQDAGQNGGPREQTRGAESMNTTFHFAHGRIVKAMVESLTREQQEEFCGEVQRRLGANSLETHDGLSRDIP